ncbi:MAG: hypothetical protein HQM10_13800 [Candidatus Riflebacteria bacterium]|nr:hypothetical protein [Candidatus Riflebacteria bacterium]
MRKNTLIVGFLFTFCVSSLFALIGVPCDPEKDFSGTYLIDNWQQLPHKNQEETLVRVKEVNSKGKEIKWKFDPTANVPLYACLSYGASSMADWWAIEKGWKLPKYKSYTRGVMETGFNPRKLELMYRKRSSSSPVDYYMTFTGDNRDPITGEAVPIRPKGFAKILTDRIDEVLMDYIDDIEFQFKPGDYPMEGKWLAIVSKNWDKKAAETKLINAIHDYGPMHVQFEIPGKHYLMGTHAPIVVGYGKLPNGKVAFICHDSFGVHSKDYKQDGAGAATYRYVLAEEIDEAIVFPHRPVAVAYPTNDAVAVEFKNMANRPLRVRKALFVGNDGQTRTLQMTGKNVGMISPKLISDKKLKVYVEAEYYMNEDGKGHWFNLEVQSSFPAYPSTRPAGGR